jgi:hypothetical protein
VGSVDEARRLLDRLERIESLKAQGAEPRALLVEVRALLLEGESWLSAEGETGGRAALALGRLATALGDSPR